MKHSDNDKETGKIVEAIVSTYDDNSGTNFIDVKNLPVRDRILEVLDALIELIFPGYTGHRAVTRDNIRFVVGDLICQIRLQLTDQIELAFRHKCKLTSCSTCDCRNLAEEVTEHLLHRIPYIREMIKSDVSAAYDGDPAAKSLEEVVISYPYIIAIAIHRIAHELYLKEVPLIPRIISESAHSKTGIDINPGAQIGKRFFIDHGTGVVIGETAVIGTGVKLYQGVTLGALSFPKDERGRIIKGGKRHPTIEDNVTIYAEATILGDITIGKDAVIGGNVWIKKSVPAGTIVAMAKQESIYKHSKPEK
ncbi:MAG: serine acetyltransferase [Planctomycetes bacterium]|nr:serine acetyltransferase [Planctomycetota bacterium]